jgi:hypothetical protein
MVFMKLLMDDPKFQEWIQTGWRRPLQPDELAQVEEVLADNRQARAHWEAEAALNRCLDRLVPPVVSSNFTARVLAQAGRQPRPRAKRNFLPSQWIPAGWLPRLAVSGLMVCLGLFSAREYQVLHRARLAQQMVTVSRLATLPPMDWLKNFDTINKLSKVKVADEDLLTVLE